MLLKNPTNSKTEIGKVQTLYKKCGLDKTCNMTCKLMINKHVNICDGIY